MLTPTGRRTLNDLIKFLNAVHGLSLESPITKLAAAGLMPERSLPRARVLQEADLPAWRTAVDKLGEAAGLFVFDALKGLEAQ
jgi:hypothetical protein